jgi:hypothetical protein
VRYLAIDTQLSGAHTQSMGLLKKAANLKAAHRESTASELRENHDRTRFKTYKPTKLAAFTVRLSTKDKARLQDLCDMRSASMGYVVRSIVVEYLNNHLPE